MTGKDESFKDFVLDQLHDLEEVAARRMFGGHGLYQDETFFGIAHRGKLFFKIDDNTVDEYRTRKMKPFRPNGKQTLKSYYQVQWISSKMRMPCRRGPNRRFSARRRSVRDEGLGVRFFSLAER